VCEGNSDERLTSLSNMHENVMMNHSSKYTLMSLWTHGLSDHIATTGTGVVATKTSTRTGTKSTYHSNCEILISSLLNPAHCSSCKKHRKSLSAMVSRPQKDEWTHPSS